MSPPSPKLVAAAHNKKGAKAGPAGKPRGSRVVTFVTGNPGKLEDFNALLAERKKLGGHFKVRNHDLVEIQGTHEEIAFEKCRRAADLLRCPVLVEDTSLEFKALHGLPGPYIKWFWNALGNEQLPSMLAAYSDKSAVAKSFVAYSAGPGSVVELFYGECRGRILDMPKGPQVHGWLPLFVPEGHDRSLAEMGLAERYQHYHRAKAFVNFFTFFEETQLKGQGSSSESESSATSDGGKGGRGGAKPKGKIPPAGSLETNIYMLPGMGIAQPEKKKKKK